MEELAWPQGTANWISIGRAFLVGPLVHFILSGNIIGMISILAVAAFSDLADGEIARRWDIETELGAWLDPTADKILMASIFITIIVVLNFRMWPWLIPILLGDLILGLMGIFGLIFLDQIEQKFGSNWWGKWKFTNQCLVAFFVLYSTRVEEQWLNPTILGLILTAIILAGLSIWKHTRDQRALVQKILGRKS